MSVVASGGQVSPRELQCLRLIAAGNSNRDIGQVLYLSEFTVKTHIGRLYRRLGARDRAHCVALGYERGLLEVGAVAS